MESESGQGTWEIRCVGEFHSSFHMNIYGSAISPQYMADPTDSLIEF